MAEDSSLSNFHSHFLYNKEMKNTIVTFGIFLKPCSTSKWEKSEMMHNITDTTQADTGH